MDAFKRISPIGLLVLWAITRAWAIGSGMSVIPYPLSEFLFSDVQLYDWWSSNIADGHFPINDPMWQYPPLAALIFFAGFLIAPNTVGFVVLAVIADAIMMAVLVAASRKQHHETFAPALIWLSAPLVMGPIMFGRFDVFPTLVMALGLLAATKPIQAGAWFALGTLLKVWPGLGLLTVKRSQFVPALSAFIVTSVAGSLVLKMWWPGSFSFIDGQRSRGLQIESVGALPYMWWNATSAAVRTEFRYGSIEVVAAGTSKVSFIITAVSVVALARILLWRVQGRIENAHAADVALLVVLIAMVTSRVLSPQYNLWIFGILAVSALTPSKHFALKVKLFFVSAFAGQVLYPFAYVSYQEGEVFPTAVQTVRVVTLVALTVISWRELSQIAKRPDQTQQVVSATS